MRVCVRLVSALLVFFATQPQNPTVDTSGPALLRRALAALVSPGDPPKDIVLSGLARRISGSDDETGTAVLKAISSGASREELSLPSGKWTEVLRTSQPQPSGSWSGPDGVTREIAFHNLLVGSSWFYPTLVIAPAVSNNDYLATSLGRKTRNGQTVEHIVLCRPSPSAIPNTTVSYQHLSQLDLFVDAATLFPAAITFSIHPENAASTDIPIEVRFSDYRSLSGVQIPFHIQKFMNGSLTLDLQIQSATLNSGLPANEFTVQ